MKILALSLLAALTASAAFAEAPAETPEARRERAAELRRQAASERGDAETRYKTETPACYERFLVNSCLEEAKKRRTASLIGARRLETEAREIENALRREEVEARAAKRREEAPRREQEARERAARNQLLQAESLRRLQQRQAEKGAATP